MGMQMCLHWLHYAEQRGEAADVFSKTLARAVKQGQGVSRMVTTIRSPRGPVLSGSKTPFLSSLRQVCVGPPAC